MGEHLPKHYQSEYLNVVPEVIFSEREFNPVITAIHPDYYQLGPEIIDLYSGHLGNFSPVAIDKQDISSALENKSRKLHLTHPEYPGLEFVAGGIGLVEVEDNRLHVAIPNKSLTIHQAMPNLSADSMATGYVNENGEFEEVRSSSPWGGYSVSQAEQKYDVTNWMNSFMEASEIGFGYTSIASGKLDDDLGLVMYAYPRNSQSYFELFLSHDLSDEVKKKQLYRRLEQPPFAQNTSAFQLLRYLHQHDILHNQFHLRNVRVTEDGTPVIGDWDTLRDVRAFASSEIVHNPKRMAIKYDLYKSMMMFSGIHDRYSLDNQIGMIASAAIGYIGNIESKEKIFNSCYSLVRSMVLPAKDNPIFYSRLYAMSIDRIAHILLFQIENPD